MFVEQGLVLRADSPLDPFEILVNVIGDTGEVFPILTASVEAIEHLTRIVDRGQGLVVLGIDHSRPGVRPIRNGDTELKGAKPSPGRLR